MESATKTVFPPEKVARVDTDYSLCIICQTKSAATLVQSPSAYEKILLCIRERAKYGDRDYPEISRRLGNVSSQDLEEKSASWHRKCQQNTVHAGMLNRAKGHYEKRLSSKGIHDEKSSQASTTFTRSHSTPYKNDLCFFCDLGATRTNSLHLLATGNASVSLKEAIAKSGDEQLRVKLSTSINPTDAHAIDVKYHKRCWAIHVTNVWRVKKSSEVPQASIVVEVAAEIEFLSLAEGMMLDGKILNMGELQDTFTAIRSANNVTRPECPRKVFKQLLQNEIPGIEFNKPKRINEPERCTIKTTRDEAINRMEETEMGMESDMRVLYKASSILRRAIRKADKWTFTGNFSDSTSEHVPEELYIFYRWLIQGPNTTLSTDKEYFVVNKHAVSLAQSNVAKYLSPQQVGNKVTKTFKMTHEMPQQLAIGIAMRQATRSKKVVDMLHKFGVSVEYNRLLRIEGQIASTVLQRMAINDGLYMPPDVVMGRYLFFAVDNVDFAEDTTDGKRTLHATAMAIYQRCDPGDEIPKLELTGPAQMRSITDLPSITTKLVDCPKPTAKPQSPSYASFCVREGTNKSEYLPDVAWLMGRTLRRFEQKEDVLPHPSSEEHEEAVSATPGQIPMWSAYHSLVSTKLPLTRVGTPPLIAAPAHEWNTLLTVLMQAQGISTKVVGPNHKTVVSLDMGLYKPAKQLQMACNDMDHLILRPGELHIVMAQLRCIGCYIENSGLDFCWTEADLYGPVTVRQILEGKHVKRGLNAHMITLQSLFTLHQQAFFESECDLLKDLSAAADDLALTFVNQDPEETKKAHSAMVNIIDSEQVMDKIDRFDAQDKSGPGALVLQQYMQMVMDMILFIRAVRTGNWKLHLTALESFTKHFFAHDKLVYARMIPLYLADMESVKENDKEVYQEFENGNMADCHGTYAYHFLKMHAERRHRCGQCTRAFGTASDLVRHQGACGRFFSCSCGCPYASRNGLLSHVSRTGHKLPEEHRDPPTRKRRLLEGTPSAQTSVSVVSLPSVSCTRPMGDQAEGQGESSTSKSSTSVLATRHSSAVRGRHKSGMIEANKPTKRGGRTSFCMGNRPTSRPVLKRLLPKPGAVAIKMTALQLHSPSLILLNPSSPFHSPISEVCRLVSSDYHNSYREGAVLHSLPTVFGASHCSSEILERVSQQHPAKQMREDHLSTTGVNARVGLGTAMDASSPALATFKAVHHQVKAATIQQNKLNSPLANSQQVSSDALKTFNLGYSMPDNHLAEKVSLPSHDMSNSSCGNHKENAHSSPLGRGCSPPGVMDVFFPDYAEATGDAREGTAIDMQTQTSDFNTFLEQLFINTNTPIGRPSSATTYETSSQTELPFATEGCLGGMVDGATQTPWLDSALSLFDTQTQTDFDQLFSSPSCSVVTGYDFQSDHEIQISSLETSQNLGTHQSSETQTEVQFCSGENNSYESSVVQDVFNLVPRGTALDETISPVFISLGRVGDNTFSSCSADIPASSLDSETQTELELAFHIDSFDDGPLATGSAFTMTPSSLLDTETQTDSAAGGVRAPLNSTETQTPRTDLDDFFTSIETQTVEDDFLLADVDFSMEEQASPSYCGLPSPDTNDTTGVANKTGSSTLLSDFEF